MCLLISVLTMRFQSYPSRCALALVGLASTTHAWELVREYSGSTFFDRWDFYGFWDNLTLSTCQYFSEYEFYTEG